MPLNFDTPLSGTYSSSRASSTVFYVVPDFTPPTSGGSHASSLVFHTESEYSPSSTIVFHAESEYSPSSTIVFHAESEYSPSSTIVFHPESGDSRSSSIAFQVISGFTPPTSGNSRAPSSVFDVVSEPSCSSLQDFQASPPTSGRSCASSFVRSTSMSFFSASGNPLSKLSANIDSSLPNTYLALPNTRPPLGKVSSSSASVSVSTPQSSTTTQVRGGDYEEKRRVKEAELRACPLSQLPMLMMAGIFDPRRQAARERFIQNELKKFDADYAESIVRPR